MASVADSAGAGRAAGSGLVFVADRTAGRRAARRHSLFVNAMKWLLPASAAGVAVVYFLAVAGTTGWGGAMAHLDVPKIVADNLAMENPHYEGFNSDGGRYWVTAKKARQDLKNLSLIQLEDISGELIDPNKERTRVTAARGTFDNKQSIVELFDRIDVKGDSGVTAQLTRASIRTKEGIIASDAPVSVGMPAGTITAKQMTIRQKSKEYTFLEDVRTNLKPPERAADEKAGGKSGRAASPSNSFGTSNAPIMIAANRLDVNDVAKTAVFTGKVLARQGEAQLSSPELEVSYEGNAVAAGTEKKAETGDTAAKTDDAGGKVTRVVAKNPVVLSEGKGQQVTSRSADFDAINQKAVLEGDVVMTEFPDRRALADRAELDQAANTILLTGPVAVTQGKNELKGRRLFVNRESGKLNLTAAGPGTGRISARFTQTGGSAPPAIDKAAPKRGVALGGSFKTEPNAPVDVTAERLDVDDPARQAVFSGDVKAMQGGFQLSGAELTASYTGAAGFGGGGQKDQTNEAAKLTRIKAKKDVMISSKDGQKATGDWADYDTKANVVTLGGDVVLTQGKNVVRGTKLVIDMTTGESVISTEAGSEAPVYTSEGPGKGVVVKSGRPSAVFYPHELKQNAEKELPKQVEGWQSRATPSQ